MYQTCLTEYELWPMVGLSFCNSGVRRHANVVKVAVIDVPMVAWRTTRYNKLLDTNSRV